MKKQGTMDRMDGKKNTNELHMGKANTEVRDWGYAEGGAMEQQGSGSSNYLARKNAVAREDNVIIKRSMIKSC